MSASAAGTLRRISLAWLVAAAIMSVAPGCWSKRAPEPRADDSLRVFMGVKSLNTKFQLPAGEDFFSFHVLNFREGKLVDDAICMPSKLASGSSREMALEVLWGEQQGRTVVTMFVSSHDSHGWTRQTGETAGYWRMFNRAGAQTIDPTKPIDHLGYKILAFVQSGMSKTGSTLPFDDAVLQQPYLGAIAVKTYSSQESMDKIVHAERRMRY